MNLRLTSLQPSQRRRSGAAVRTHLATKASRALMLVTALAGVTLGSPAQAADPTRDAPNARISLGLRPQWWSSPGLDPFSTNDYSTAMSMAGDVTLLRSRPFSLAVGLGWDFSQVNGTARGFDSSLSVHRLSVPLEGRWHALHWLYAFGKFAPGVGVHTASVDVDYGLDRFADTRVVFASDFSLGASFGVTPGRARAGTLANGRRAPVRLWLSPELGWSAAGRASFALASPETRPGSEVLLPGSSDPVRLPGFSPGGPFLRFSVSLAF